MERAEEQRCIRKAIEGDRDAAACLIRAHRASLYAHLLKLSGRPDVAEDIVQDAFVRALANLERFDPRFRFSTWLFTIAKRLYVNACQKHRPRYDTDLVGASQSGGWSSPDEPFETNETRRGARRAIREALASLTEDQRQIVRLFHEYEWPIALIAEHMNMPQGTIKSHLHRSRRKMREAIEQHETHARRVEEVWS